MKAIGPDHASQASAVPRVTAEVLDRLPDELLRPTTPSRWALGQGRSGDIGSFLEAPLFDGDGGLLLADVARGRILRYDLAARTFSVITEYDGAPNGLAWAADGALLIADAHRGLLRLATTTGSRAPEAVRNGVGSDAFRGLNDVLVAADGTVYLTDQGASGLHDPTGRIVRVRPDGTADVLVATLPSPNALAYDETERALYVAVTRDNAVWRVPISDGGAWKAGRFIALSGGAGPDGIARDDSRRTFVTHLGLGVVWVFDARGLPVLAIDCPGDEVTHIALGPAPGEAIITEASTGSLLRVRYADAIGAAA
jgi:gluconolactonase